MLENCYQNAEDIKNDQVSPNNDNEDVSMKSLRDCIIYTEPLTPMLQEVLHDFDTDDDDEPKLQIVDEIAPHKNIDGTRKSDSSDMTQSECCEKQSPNKDVENAEIKQVNGKVELSKPTELSKIKSLKLKKTQRGIWENKDPVNIDNSEPKETDVETNNNISKENSGNADATKPNSGSSQQTTQRSSTSTVDTQLPNNQEGLLYCEANDKLKPIKDISVHEVEKKEHKKKSRKREHSQTNTEPKKKLKKNKNKDASAETLDLTNDTEGSIEHNGNEGPINNENHEKVLHESVLLSNNNKQPDCKSGDVSIDKETNASRVISNPVPVVSGSEINPCLESVSLFAQEFNTLQYSDSDNNNQHKVEQVTASIHQGAEEHMTKNNASSSQKNQHTFKEDDAVVVLKSNSESDSASLPERFNGLPTTSSTDKPREKALANLFGFSSGEFKVGHMCRDFI